MSRRGEIPVKGDFALFVLFFVGFALNILIFLDLQWWHYFLVPAVNPQTINTLRQGILSIQVRNCDASGVDTGTGFVVQSGYVATLARVVESRHTCGSDITVIDYKGIESPAELVAYSSSADLAVLKITDTSLPALPLVDSRAYEASRGLVPILFIDHPLEDMASPSDRAAISHDGYISKYDKNLRLFITAGVNINSSDIGGPIFLRDESKVLGLAAGKVNRALDGELGRIIPINTFKQFYLQTMSQSLE